MSPIDSPTTTLPEAKQIALETETRVAAQVPDEYVQSRTHLTQAHLLSCESGENIFRWPGQMSLRLKEDPDIPALFTMISNEWNISIGFSAHVERLTDGDPQIVISAADGGEYLVDYWPNKGQIEISSFSPCFALPEGNNGGVY